MDLSKKDTVSSKVPELDSVYVYKTNQEAKFTHREQLGTGYRYKSHKALFQAAEDEIHIYHQTLVVDKVMRGVTVVTKCDKVTPVKALFSEVKKKIKEDEATKKLFFATKSTPREIGVYFTY